MYRLTRAVISVLLKYFKELSHVPQKRALTFDPHGPVINILWQKKWGKPLLCIITLSMFMAAYMSVKKTLTWEPNFDFIFKTGLSIYVAVKVDASGEKCIPACNKSVCRPWKKCIYGGKLLVLVSANATLSFYCPAPSLSLESALRHTVKASWNIWKKGGRVREREATVQKAQ